MEESPDWTDLALVLEYLNRALHIDTSTAQDGDGVDEGQLSCPGCVEKAAELILRCRYAEHRGLTGPTSQADMETSRDIFMESRNILIHNIFESAERKVRKPLPNMISESNIATFDADLDISEICKYLSITSYEQKLVLLYIAVLNACREHMYQYEDCFLPKGKDRKDFNKRLCNSSLDIQSVMKKLEKSKDFLYINEAKKLNQFRNSVSMTVKNGEEWKKRINSAIEANEDFAKVQQEVYGLISSREREKVEQSFKRKTPGLSNTAQLLHILWTSFFKIRLEKRELVTIAEQGLRFLQAVPQMLLLPSIVERFSNENRLRWFSNRQGSLSEYFGSSMCPDMIEKLVKELQKVVTPIAGSGGKEEDTAPHLDVCHMMQSMRVPSESGTLLANEGFLDTDSALPEGLQQVETDATGHCQFDAVARQLMLHRRDTPAGVQISSYLDVRRDVAEWLRDPTRAEQFRGFLEGNFNGTTVSEFADRVGRADDGNAIQWGDHLTLVAVANVYRRPVWVWLADHPSRRYVVIRPANEEAQHAEPLRLLLIGESHYMSLEPADSVRSGTDSASPITVSNEEMVARVLEEHRR